MAEVIPFRGVLYDEKRIRNMEDVVTPPYDVISPEQQREYYARSPYNIIRLELGKERPGDSETDNKYTRAAALFRRWRAEGILKRDKDPCFYPYEQVFTYGDQSLVRIGLIGLVRLQPFEEGVILPHEQTLAGPKQDRLSLMRATRANFSPIFGIYPDESGEMQSLVRRAVQEKPLVEIDFGSVHHRFWRLDDRSLLKQLSSGFAGQRILIADGHHRYETALAYRDMMREGAGTPCEYVMMMLVSMQDQGLRIFPTHRLVHGLQRFDIGEFLCSAEQYFVVEEFADREELRKRMRGCADRKMFGIYAGGERFFGLILRGDPVTAVDRVKPSQHSTAWKSLDVSVLHTVLLEGILGITSEQIQAGEYIGFTRDEGEGIALVDSGRVQMVILMNATGIDDVRSVAGNGERMPQKSTYFYPKLLTGLVVNEF